MMHWLMAMLLALNLSVPPAVAATDKPDPVPTGPAGEVRGSFTVLCYHEARRDVRDYPDPFAVDTAALIRQFAWLHGNGYTPVSLDDVLAARQGGKALPPKAVLLSFDDAYLSFYTRVYPLLREFRFPAVLGVVGRWIDGPRHTAARYGEKGTVAEASFPSWGQLREMAASGLVEIASHTYDMHRGIPANPQGNLQPAATARAYDAATAGYESDDAWRARVRADLLRNANEIERGTGRRPRTVVWPYGSYNGELVRIAGEIGMSIALTLEDGANTPDVPLTALRRVLIEHNPALGEFATEERGPLYQEPIRVVQVDLDDVYSADPAQQERNLSVLIDRIQVLKPTHVYLRATADTDGDGIADAAYFPNRYLPLRSDLFNRAAWQLASRNDVKVFALMPVTGFRLPPGGIAEVYDDLARYADFDGLVFDDRPDDAAVDDALTREFTLRLVARVRAFRMPLKTVRILVFETPQAPESGPASAAHYRLRLTEFLATYDYVALRVTPAHGDPRKPDAWLAALLARIGRKAGDLDVRRRAVFLLHNRRQPLVDDAHGEDGPERNALAGPMRALQLGGALNFGYAQDDFLHDSPALARTAPAMSLRVYPLDSGNKER